MTHQSSAPVKGVEICCISSWRGLLRCLSFLKGTPRPVSWDKQKQDSHVFFCIRHSGEALAPTHILMIGNNYPDEKPGYCPPEINSILIDSTFPFAVAEGSTGNGLNVGVAGWGEGDNFSGDAD